MILIHIVDQQTHTKILENGKIQPSRSGKGHYIHCCLPDQVDCVIQKWFPEESDLFALEIDSKLVEVKVVFENLEGGEVFFPHIYGSIPIDAVKDNYQIRRSKGSNKYENSN